MTGWKRALWTVGLVFIVTCASALINAGGDIFSLDWATWQLIINAGVAAVLAFVINYLSPWIKQYGVGNDL